MSARRRWLTSALGHHSCTTLRPLCCGDRVCVAWKGAVGSATFFKKTDPLCSHGPGESSGGSVRPPGRSRGPGGVRTDPRCNGRDTIAQRLSMCVAGERCRRHADRATTGDNRRFSKAIGFELTQKPANERTFERKACTCDRALGRGAGGSIQGVVERGA